VGDRQDRPGEALGILGDRILEESEMERITLTIATVGILTAIVAGILYLMQLHIFSVDEMAWTFFGGLVSAAIGIGSLIIKSIWENTSGQVGEGR
jgi:hypothetical protein